MSSVKYGQKNQGLGDEQVQGEWDFLSCNNRHDDRLTSASSLALGLRISGPEE